MVRDDQVGLRERLATKPERTSRFMRAGLAAALFGTVGDAAANQIAKGWMSAQIADAGRGLRARVSATGHLAAPPPAAGEGDAPDRNSDRGDAEGSASPPTPAM